MQKNGPRIPKVKFAKGMKRFLKGRANARPAGHSAVISAEIEQALNMFTGKKRQTAKGLVLGIEKFRKLKEQHAATLPEAYRRMAIIVDTTQQSRISVF